MALANAECQDSHGDKGVDLDLCGTWTVRCAHGDCYGARASHRICGNFVTIVCIFAGLHSSGHR